MGGFILGVRLTGLPAACAGRAELDLRHGVESRSRGTLLENGRVNSLNR